MINFLQNIYQNLKKDYNDVFDNNFINIYKIYWYGTEYINELTGWEQLMMCSYERLF